MVFKSKSAPVAVFDDPESLYRALALTNEGPENLWSHQADVLRSWNDEKLRSEADIALELPTGAGKTLVGGLIGEYRRRKFQERVAYLCPTRQLARQTAKKLTDYGIPNVLLVNEVQSWNIADRARYNSAAAIAVSVYSHVFNSNPALNNAELLLLDDAHAAEGYVANPWKMQISRKDDESAYLDVLATLANAMDPFVFERLRTNSPSGRASTVYLASPLGVSANAMQVERVLSAAVAQGKVSTSARHAWKFLEGHIEHCLIYVTGRDLLIRPLIVPTVQHAAFNNPARRVYMSATLGSGGELERSFGRRKITRIPIPKGWEKQGTGRRFFSFPELTSDLSTDEEKLNEFISETIKRAGRAIVLSPDNRTADAFVASKVPDGFDTLRADEVEENLDVFVENSSAVLVLTNRYDGIDLPDKDCRLVILNGLPANGDLQEQFLHKSLGAVEVLQERIRARIMQGSGRATRNSRDYAAVLVLGSDLTSYLTNLDVQGAMHPEVHAELEFGLENSIDTTSDEMTVRLETFERHDTEWAAVDSDIVTARELHVRKAAPGTDELQRAARREVVAYEAIWAGDWQQSLISIRQVVDRLSAGRGPKRYAALWNYLAFNVASRLASAGDESLHASAEGYYRAARAASRGTNWLSHLAAPAEATASPTTPNLDQLDEAAMRGVLGATDLAKPQNFESQVAVARAGLAATEYKAYEDGLVLLGELAGAAESYTYNDEEEAATPDAVWIFGDAQWVVWEAKSMSKLTGSVGAGNVRQAGGHLNHVETERGTAAPSDSVAFLDTPKPGVLQSARNVADAHVYLVRPNQVLELFDRLVRAWQNVRARDLTSMNIEEVAAIFRAEEVLPTQWLPRLRTQPLRLRD
ncbi:hypothetical protein JOJ86_005868 [Rhodococcus percolatus]|uniref:DEAD/DEAH box helicase family protein n=1 Tax=Rhodococcus opacus TaxID=37919 RepID=UPI0015F846DC|nr:DEAD/DEAH box helicase family protein [Rhodococcus opacus]MBA8963896.1 hypothetical protein [Rhodococcus opacus]MBP2208142.1 hypothetical protein [Rhodococcus opacus]